MVITMCALQLKGRIISNGLILTLCLNETMNQ